MNKQMMLAALALAMLVSAGCEKTKTTDEYPAAPDTNSPSVKEIATNAWQKTKETATNAWTQTKETTVNAWADIKDSVQTTKDYTYDKKDAFVTSASADLDALDAKIKELS